MQENTITQLSDPSIAGRRLRSNLPRGGFSADPFTDVIRDGARKLIEQAVHAELAALMAAFSGERLEDGRARLVRHGHLPEREVMTGIGPVPVKVPRVRDRGATDDKITFTPSILPRYPLPGSRCLQRLPGNGWCPGVLDSPARGVRHDAGTTLLGPQDHERAERAAEIRAGQGQGSFARHPLAGRVLRSNVPRGWQAETKAEANVAFDFFVATYGVKWEKAVAKLVKDRDALLTFYDYPAERAQALANMSERQTRLTAIEVNRLPASGSRAHSRPFGTARNAPKSVSAAKRTWPWPSS